MTTSLRKPAFLPYTMAGGRVFVSVRKRAEQSRVYYRVLDFKRCIALRAQEWSMLRYTFLFLLLGCVGEDLTVSNPGQVSVEAPISNEVVCTTSDDCHDGDWCTNNFCTNGQCQFLPKSDYAVLCDDGNPCTTDWCYPAKRCVNTPLSDGNVCDDGDWCTVNSACVAGVCVGSGNACEDGDPCTINYCSQDGCTYTQTDCSP